MTNFLASHSRFVSIFLLILFCFFMLFSFSALQAEAIAGVDDIIIVVIFGALLTTMGVTFASTQDLEVAYNGFMADESYAYYNEAHSVVAQATAGYLANGVLDFADNWSDGWNYFTEHVAQYFGFETGVLPVVPPESLPNLYIDGVSVPFVVGAIKKDFSSNIVNPTSDIYTDRSNPVFDSEIFRGLSSGVSPVVKIMDDLYYRARLVSSGQYYPEFSVDGITFTNKCPDFGPLDRQYFESPNSHPVNDPYRALFLLTYVVSDGILYIAPSAPKRYENELTTLIVTALPNSSQAYRYWWRVGPLEGRISICPDIELGGEKYRWQDVVGTLAEMKEALQHITWDMEGILSQVGVMTDGVLTGLKDWTLTQSDVIPDALEKELDKTNPSPPPEPTSSPNPSPLPPGDFPVPKLPPAITTKFPFSLPWDVYRLMSILEAPAKAPKFVIPLNFPSMNYKHEIVIDISDFDAVVVVIRWGMTLIFVLGLVLITRKIVR